TPHTIELYTLSLHDALPIWRQARQTPVPPAADRELACGFSSTSTRAAAGSPGGGCPRRSRTRAPPCAPRSRPISSRSARIGSSRSEEHTSELQSLRHLVCRL